MLDLNVRLIRITKILLKTSLRVWLWRSNRKLISQRRLLATQRMSCAFGVLELDSSKQLQGWSEPLGSTSCTTKGCVLIKPNFALVLCLPSRKALAEWLDRFTAWDKSCSGQNDKRTICLLTERDISESALARVFFTAGHDDDEHSKWHSRKNNSIYDNLDLKHHPQAWALCHTS